MIYQHHDGNNASAPPKQQSGSSGKPCDEIALVAARMAFLLLECVLTMAVGSNGGLKQITESIGVPPVELIVEWLESLPVVNSTSGGSSNSNNTTDSQNKDPQLKFLFNLYTSRLALADLDPKNGKHVDSHIRSARKDMKTAMEVFQHKLRPNFGATDTSSVVSSANSEENMSMSGNNSSIIRQQDLHQQQQPPPPSSVVLQKLNQSALSLKAHLEQLKGNTKKSLILCSEALGAEDTNANNNSTYEAVHSNNLAVVYETNNKRHLALHALAKSLRANCADINSNTSGDEKTHINDNNNMNEYAEASPTTTTAYSSLLFHPDGTARPKITLSILHNAAICALRARNYQAAYECFATCVARSERFYDRPVSWLRMAEACVRDM
jgi:hypothetical protein